MTPAFNLILFDLDGTLVETGLEIGDAVNDTLHRFSLPEVAQNQVNDWIGHGTRSHLYPQVREVLEDLRAQTRAPTRI